MTQQQQQEMHELAVKLERLTADPPWENMRYMFIAETMEKLATYCAVCDCKQKKQP